MYKCKKIIIGLLFTLIALPTYAAPSISNETPRTGWSHGGNITITGNRFGEKIQASPVIWDNLEDGNADLNATIGNWSSKWDTIVATTEEKHAGGYSGLCGPLGYPNYSQYHKNLSETGLPDGQKIYASLWRRRTDSVMTQVWNEESQHWEYTVNQKLFRIFPTTGGDPYPNILLGTGSTGANGNVTAEGVNDNYWLNFRSALLEDTWQFEEVEIQLSSGLNLADGIWRYYIDGIQHVNVTSLLDRTTEYADPVNEFRFTNQGTLPGYVYMDDLYLDTSWARVVIGDNPVYENCTHREIQIPWTDSQWIDSQITNVHINQGSLPDGQAYLFVVDENGIPSGGYEITLGGSSDATSPSAPSGLSII